LEPSPTERRRAPRSAAAAPALLNLVGAALIVAALYLGRDLLVPLVLAVLLAFVLAPLAGLLRRIGLPNAPSVLLAVLAGVGLLGALGLLVLRQLATLAGELGTYAGNIKAKFDRLRIDEWLRQAQAVLDSFRELFGGVQPDPVPTPAAEASPIEVAAAWAGPVLAPLATAAIVIVFALFILMYREDLRDRLVRLAGVQDLHRTVGALDDAAWRLSRLFLAQLALNVGFGVLVGVGLWLLGLPGAPLWGVLAGLMRFVPFIGTPIAIGPPVLLALGADPGWGLAIGVMALFAATEPLMGQLAEPLVFGRSTGLSPLSVMVAATFWTFMWGPIGLLLSTPLTVGLVVLGRHVPRLEFLDVMLGNRPPLKPEESFYHRALEGDADALVAQARAHMKAGGALLAWHDEVALRGIALAEADWSREELEAERLAVVRQQVETLLDELGETPLDAASHPPEAWRMEGAVLCVAGRGRLDDMAAAVAAQGLRHEGFGARVLPSAVLEGAEDGRLDPAVTRLCLLSVLEEGSSAAAVRYFLRRLKRRLPNARVLVALWHAPADSRMLAELREDGGGADSIVTSLGEAAAFVMAAADRPAPTQARKAAAAPA
jgi:predicted PurR-regulated permease PerM